MLAVERRNVPYRRSCTPVRLRDGRAIGVAEYGACDGAPVFYFHGFPASRLEARLASDAAARAGVRLIALDRPGYGESDPLPGRTIADWADDVAQVADRLGLDRFAIVGVSGGGPYALACGSALPHRVSAVAVVGGLGMLSPGSEATDFAWLPRMSFRLARDWPAASHALNRSLAGLVRRRPDLMLTLLAARMSSADRQVLDGEVIASLAASVSEALRRGADAATRELALYANPWNFSLDAIRAPCYLWYGEDDRTVPASVGRRLAAQLPGSRAVFLRDEGHFSLPLRHAQRILGALCEHR